MKNRGFTLIELVSVIVILGIISVTAAPRFLNLKSDATKATLDGFVGAFNATNEIVMGKATIEGLEKEKLAKLPDQDIWIRWGVIALDSNNVENAMQTDDYQLLSYGNPNTPSLVVYTGKERTLRELKDYNCFVQFTRSYTIVGSEIVDIGDLTINKFYQGC
ncbi:MSHA pilin protein MshA [Vibrio crassostreae]|uniref:MSHA pilin protein MshA n=2 Tax=Vibrio crassostreae TaxID=246167 RepID=A0ABM9QPF1_9VIBR|nr:type II secretion system protein [Vibrio crassostreae]ROO75821.1 MSHA pilin protein MshA [Vibrio crassostreae]ROP13828.1 MSHA pilin protein MshA [Vibrio crassostreae]ROQ87916.1 MSHA pilin protein MshA [Vibrio crassostreae]ROR87725.1 MSHA pilin protein MshA [Vibrio crassostreae]RPE94934.1 MSHA pilin protein MshA [Vibrio crassostreae]